VRGEVSHLCCRALFTLCPHVRPYVSAYVSLSVSLCEGGFNLSCLFALCSAFAYLVRPHMRPSTSPHVCLYVCPCMCPCRNIRCPDTCAYVSASACFFLCLAGHARFRTRNKRNTPQHPSGQTNPQPSTLNLQPETRNAKTETLDHDPGVGICKGICIGIVCGNRYRYRV
jgi:hypothetical protein